ncbi:MAG TPA: adenylate/guanylate cyclase domain-containing protein [Candidatus Binatia bacterium]|nr:adenylate/guanylate cyclase domain-containing protein [Candidatus Binatia bacterium]
MAASGAGAAGASGTIGAAGVAGAGGAAAGGLRPDATPVAERRLVTILFADLVGFTSLAEGRDPEEVRELLSRYFEATREQIERYGGTVEKFIGDAVMAVWGAPTAHEDDAERAVRAALEVVDAVKALAPGLQARAGVLSGEAAVTVGARGQGMVAGDLVNTASRLQSAAQPGMVLVGESTQRATSNSIAYEPAGEQLLKGKTAPVTAYRALRVVAERGGRGRGDRLEAPFVGRDAELRLLKDLFHATAREGRVRLVSITGTGGVGKSRLMWELKKYADGVAEDVWWHEGRSPAYGSGITFWALGEMVRARAEINETDDPATTRAKLAASVASFIPEGPDRERVERALQALLGVAEGPTAASGELFGAWRLYFERMAAQGVLVMAFEDLHWADAGLLDFIDHLLDWSRNVPILIVTLARPELLDRRPEWGAGRRNFLALDLEPLSETAMRELLDGFVPGLSSAAVRSIVARAEGIPLYAVETIRMLAADGRLREREGGGFEPAGELGELAVPDTLHALIAARLDNLDPAERSLIQDAAVLGQSFTPAGLAAVSGLEPGPLAARLRTLVKSDLLVEDVDPRSPERGQFAFVQALIREVAYSTLSLKDRRARHLAAARFFESLGDDELAGALASHYLAAYRATPGGEGASDEAAALATQARIALRAAADRAVSLGSLKQAIAFLEQALEVAADPAEQADLLELGVDLAIRDTDFDRALSWAPRLRELRDAGDDIAKQADAVELHARALHTSRHREAAIQMTREALVRFESLGDHPARLRLMVAHAVAALFDRDYDEAMEWSEQALEVAERIGDAENAAKIFTLRGQLAMYQGRIWESIALAEGARRLGEQYGLPLIVNRANATLTNAMALDDPGATVEVEKEMLEYDRRQGLRERMTVTLGNMAEDARRLGDWDWIVGWLDDALRDEDRNFTDLIIETVRSTFAIFRGTISADQVEDIAARLGALGDIDLASSAHEVRAVAMFAAGEFRAAVEEWYRQAEMSDLNAPYALPKAGIAAVLAGEAPIARDVVARLRHRGVRGRAVEADMATILAGAAGLEGDRAAALAGFRGARGVYRDLGLDWDAALLGLTAARALGAAEPEAAGWLTEARSIFERIRAKPLVAIADELVTTSAPPADGQSRSRSQAGRRTQEEASSSST